MHDSARHVATLVISVDIDQALEGSTTVTALTELLNGHRVPALWSFGFFRAPTVVDTLREQTARHEFGLLAHRSWTHADVSRRDFTRELAARFACAMRAGCTPIALAFRDAAPPDHLDVLGKFGLSIVRVRYESTSRGTGTFAPRWLKGGAWQSVPTTLVPAPSRWTLPWSLHRMLRQAVRERHLVHITIDGDRLARNPASGLATLSSLLNLANTLQECEQLQIVPPSDAHRMSIPRRELLASRSILRAA
jgi:hypothetical protein